MKTQIYNTIEEFCNRGDKQTNGVSPEFAASNPNFEAQNETNEACWCCSGCSGCSDCSGYSRCSTVKGAIQIPIIENIHQKVLAAVKNDWKLEMGNWHKETPCGTTHCRGGSVIMLAGEAGRKLEEQTSSEFAAMAIYSKSSSIRVSPVRFYESNEVAMKDIERCAAEEIAAGGSK